MSAGIFVQRPAIYTFISTTDPFSDLVTNKTVKISNALVISEESADALSLGAATD